MLRDRVLQLDLPSHPKTWAANSHPKPVRCLPFSPEPTANARSLRKPASPAESCPLTTSEPALTHQARPLPMQHDPASDQQTRGTDLRQNPETLVRHWHHGEPRPPDLAGLDRIEGLAHQRPGAETTQGIQHQSRPHRDEQSGQRVFRAEREHRPRWRVHHPSDHHKIPAQP